MDDYISASDAATQIGMSPARFANLLMNRRDILPTEINNTALANNPFAIFASKALEKFYAGNPAAINLCYLKIHRLDWDTYVASLSIAAATPTAETEAVLAATPSVAPQPQLTDESPTSANVDPATLLGVTAWGQLSVVFVNDLTVEIHGNGTRSNHMFNALGFSDNRRNDEPNSLWTLLKLFAESRGELSPQKDITKKISGLRQALKTAFPSLQDDPIRHDKARHTYCTAFQVSSRISLESAPQGVRQDIQDEFSG